MKQDKDILTKLDHKDGMTVPENYFADFVKHMETVLPERPELYEPQDVVAVPRSLWQRVRPYAYMAAMFAGVWCMLKMFTMLTADSPQPFDTNPIMAEAFSNETFVNEYVIPEINQWDLYDDLMDEGFSPEGLLDSIQMNNDHHQNDKFNTL